MKTNTYLAPYVRSFFEDYLTCRRNVSANTIQSYRDAVKLFLEFVAANLKMSAAKTLMADITEPLVLGFLSSLEQDRGNTVQTRNHRLTVLHRLFEYIASREPLLLDRCHRIVTIPLKRGAETPPISYLTKEEVRAVFDAVDRRTPRGGRDYALLLFMYNTGARVQEVADAKVSWLTLQTPCRTDILGKGHKWRTCPLWESTAQALRQVIEKRLHGPGPEEHLFLNRLEQPLSRSGIEDIIQKYTALAARKVPSLRGKNVTPHTIRHTTAMHLLQSGVEVNVIRSWLGHVSIATTNRYIEIDLEMKARALKSCEVPESSDNVKRWRSAPEILTWLNSL